MENGLLSQSSNSPKIKVKSQSYVISYVSYDCFKFSFFTKLNIKVHSRENIVVNVHRNITEIR